MNKTTLGILMALALFGVGTVGFFAGNQFGAKTPAAQRTKAQERIEKLEKGLKKAKSRIAELEKELKSADADATGYAKKLAKAQKRIAAQERNLAAATNMLHMAEAAIPSDLTNGFERVVTIDAKDAKDADILDSLKSQLSHDEFSQVTNAMSQLRTRLAEKAKGRMEYLASINTDGMSAAERKNHAKYLELMQRREEIASKMKGGFPNAESIQKMVELEMEMAPVAKKERSALVGQVARELGYQGEDVNVVRDTVDTIFDCTSSGGLGGLGDIMESAGGAPGMEVSPGVKVETHVIGL